MCKDCGNCYYCSKTWKNGRKKSNCKTCDTNDNIVNKMPIPVYKYNGKYYYRRDICEHGIPKSKCKPCICKYICEHGISKSKCKICICKDICEHGIVKIFCKDCGNCYYCSRTWKHGRKKLTCKTCVSKETCKQETPKMVCKESLYNNQICEHEKQKSRCKICNGSALCKSSWCETFGNKKYEGFCLACFVNNPENHHKPAMRNYKTKEKYVVDHITQTFTDFTWVADKRVQDGCSRRRPDLLLDMGSHIIIVEIDENKHSNYDCSCEHKRLMELSQDLQHRPIVFIRFNPDDYTNQEGLLIKSCWKLSKFGIMQIMKTKEKEWEERIDILKQQIQYWIDNPTQKTIEIIELFY